MIAPNSLITTLYQVLPCKKSKEYNNNITYDTNSFLAEWAGRFRLNLSVATQEFDALFDQADDLLSIRINNLMKIFVNHDPNFYTRYLKAREIVDYQEKEEVKTIVFYIDGRANLKKQPF